MPLPGDWLANTVFKDRAMTKNATADEVEFALSVIRSCRPLTRGLHAVALLDIDLGDSAEHLTVPTTVIAGSNDLLLPERLSRRIVELLDRTGFLADYRVWPTGHLGNIEAADRFNAVLEQVVARSYQQTATAV